MRSIFCGLAGLRACGLAGLRACGLAGLRACGLAALVCLASASAAFAQISLIKSEYPGPASQRTDVRSPNNKVETLGDSGCQTTIYGYEATSTQLIVKTIGQPRSCSFADLKFILNGKSYDLEGIDTNFYVNSRGSYVWKENPNANAWIWFNIGTRLPADALEKATGSLGVYEYACKSNQNCLTFSRIDIVSTEPLVAAAKAKLVAAGGTTSATANASAGTNDNKAAPTGVRRVTALLLPSTADGPQALSAYSRTGARCDFVWPFDGPVIESPYVDLLHVDSPKPIPLHTSPYHTVD